MKNIIFILFLFFQLFSYCQIIPIPDANFKNKLINADTTNPTAGYIKIDINNNGEIEVNEAHQITYLSVIMSSISDLTGIEYFINLESLSIQYNSISSIDVSSLNSLNYFRCDFNNISNINFSGLTSLKNITCDYNNISNLSLNGLNNLISLGCSNNQLTTLDLSQNPLQKLYCKNNNLTSLNIKNGINQDFSISGFNDCWKTGNPNLTTICVDASEQAAVQSFINGCGTAQTINITSNCGLSNEVFATNEIVLYPNPTNAIITIRSEENINSIELYDNFGRVLVSKKVNEPQTLLDVSNYSNGVYFVKVTSDNGFKIQKVIKQ